MKENRGEEPLIVVTGGAGFIGSEVIRYLNKNEEKNIVIVDDLGSSQKWKNLVDLSYSDIISRHTVFEWLERYKNQIAAIIHLGACSSTVETNADYLLNNNYRYSVKLATFALENELRFIYASSAATYGDGSQGFNDAHEELEKLAPLNMYGYSKHLFDLWLKNEGYLDKVVGLKYFNVYGPHESHKGRMASAIFHMYPKVCQEGVVRLFKSNDSKFCDGGQQRDFIYVKDAAKLTCAFLKNKATGIYNIGISKPRSWNELAGALFAAVGKPVNIEYIAMPDDLMGKYQNYTSAEMGKAKTALENLFPEGLCSYSLEDGVKDYVENYLTCESYAK